MPANFSPVTAVSLATKDLSRVQGKIARALAEWNPFINVLEGGIFAAGVSDSVRSVIQEQALPGDSLIAPTFADWKDICDVTGSSEDTATTEYSYKLQAKRGRGPAVCVNEHFASVAESLTQAYNSLTDLMQDYTNADVQNQLYTLSGTKYVAANAGTVSFPASITEGTNRISATFANVGSANIAQLSFKAVSKLTRYLRETLLVPMFESREVGPHYKFIGSADLLESFRVETAVQNILLAQTQGGFKYGTEALKGYSWESYGNFKGVAFGSTPRPLRATSINGSGQPVFVEPFVAVEVANGKFARRPNPAWVAAEYEIAFLIGKGSFKRLVPEKYVGEGPFKFSPQLHMGELKFFVDPSNPYGDKGYHFYQIVRAIKPERPHHVVAILHRRCPFDSGNVACVTTGSIL